MSTKPSPAIPSPTHKTPLTQSTRANTPAVAPPPPPPDQPTPTTTTTPTPTAPFPSPQTFDILPPLHALLIRLLSTPPHAQQAAATHPDATSEPVLLSTPGDDTTSMHSLDPRALVTGASTVKIRIQKARSAVAELPDIQRSVGEQEEEIRELQGRIARLKGVIEEFGRRGADVLNGS